MKEGDFIKSGEVIYKIFIVGKKEIIGAVNMRKDNNYIDSRISISPELLEKTELDNVFKVRKA